MTLTEPAGLVLEETLFGLPAGAVVEVPFLLSARQLSALEEAAHRCGVTAGELARRALQAFLAQLA
jgi:hypothetical protein